VFVEGIRTPKWRIIVHAFHFCCRLSVNNPNGDMIILSTVPLD